MKSISLTQQTHKPYQVGDWTYHPSSLVVRYRENTGYEREVDLEQCHTSADMLDWIFQFASKRWATPQAIGDLVRILNHLLRPKGTLCSWGKERGPIPTGVEMRRQIANRLKQREVVDEHIDWPSGLGAAQPDAT